MLTATPQADSRSHGRLLARLQRAAHRPLPADSVAVFRIAFGLVAVFGSLRFLARGWVDTLYLAPTHHLTYAGFDWVQPLPAPWMHLHLLVLAGLGACIALGWHHRAAAWMFTLGFLWTELIDASLYLNHYWFVTLAGLLLAVLPVHHRWSLDARAGRVIPSPVVPAIVVWALRAQVAVVYVFAGLAKLNADWLLRGEPLHMWLSDRTGIALVGQWLDEPVVAHLASLAGAAFDLSVVGFLLWRRTRLAAWLVVIVFHVVTGTLFRIGVFPAVMILATLVFFEPDWPSTLWAKLTGRPVAERCGSAGSPPVRRPLLVGLVVLAAVEVILPLRHLAIPGDVRLTEEGYYLSWRVMLTEKSGHLVFRVTNPDTGETREVEPTAVLTDWQAAQAAIRPDLLHTTAHIIAAEERRAGNPEVQVRADAWVSMNGRPAQRLVDPTADLAADPRHHGHHEWVVDLDGDLVDPPPD